MLLGGEEFIWEFIMDAFLFSRGDFFPYLNISAFFIPPKSSIVIYSDFSR